MIIWLTNDCHNSSFLKWRDCAVTHLSTRWHQKQVNTFTLEAVFIHSPTFWSHKNAIMKPGSRTNGQTQQQSLTETGVWRRDLFWTFLRLSNNKARRCQTDWSPAWELLQRNTVERSRRGDHGGTERPNPVLRWRTSEEEGSWGSEDDVGGWGREWWTDAGERSGHHSSGWIRDFNTSVLEVEQ